MIDKAVRRNLQLIVDAYSKGSGRSVSAISKQFYGNAGFLADFFTNRQGISLIKLDSMVAAIKKEWPSGTPWPVCKPIEFAGPDSAARKSAGARRGKLSPEKQPRA
jgi:hypothetical protein